MRRGRGKASGGESAPSEPSHERGAEPTEKIPAAQPCTARSYGKAGAFVFALCISPGSWAMRVHIDQEGQHHPDPPPASYADAGGIDPEPDQRGTRHKEYPQQGDHPDPVERM